MRQVIVFTSSKSRYVLSTGVIYTGYEVTRAIPKLSSIFAYSPMHLTLKIFHFISGILVQLPLPKHINEERVLSEISIEKDVDGFHPLNIGKLAMKGREPLFLPCTPKVLLNFKITNT